eukprot:scaffold127267_cov21-Tisochrysis_lutea.AAC.1
MCLPSLLRTAPREMHPKWYDHTMQNGPPLIKCTQKDARQVAQNGSFIYMENGDRKHGEYTWNRPKPIISQAQHMDS